MKDVFRANIWPFWQPNEMNVMLDKDSFHWFIECKCGCLLHSIRIILDENDGEVCVETHLNPWLPWYKRLWLAVRYVVGLEPKQCHYDSTILQDADFQNLRLLFDRSQQIKKKIQEK